MAARRNRNRSALSRQYPLLIVIMIAMVLLSFYRQKYQTTGRQTQAAGPSGVVQVHILDVGQGCCILIDAPDKKVLIDCGEKDMGARVLDSLSANGIRDIDLLVETHPHTDHYGGMETVLQNVKVSEILMPKIPQKLVPDDQDYAEFLDAVRKEGAQMPEADVNWRYDLGGGAVLTLLGPTESFNDLNDCSLVFRLDYQEASFLFTGDIEKAAENSLMEHGADLDVDILSVAHHGSGTSSQQSFLNRCTPMVSVISVGEGNSYGHPQASVVKRLSEWGPIYRTDLNGTVTLITDGQKITAVAERSGSRQEFDAAA